MLVFFHLKIMEGESKLIENGVRRLFFMLKCRYLKKRKEIATLLVEEALKKIKDV